LVQNIIRHRKEFFVVTAFKIEQRVDRKGEKAVRRNEKVRRILPDRRSTWVVALELSHEHAFGLRIDWISKNGSARITTAKSRKRAERAEQRLAKNAWDFDSAVAITK